MICLYIFSKENDFNIFDSFYLFPSFALKLQGASGTEEDNIYTQLFVNFDAKAELDKARDTLLGIAARDSSKSVKVKLLLTLK